ncbi:MAG: FHA domain-containing protein, partial [Myxococcota bacterium]
MDGRESTPSSRIFASPSGDFAPEATEPFKTRRHDASAAAQVIVPQSRPADSAGPVAKIVYRSPDGLETDFVLDDMNTVGRHPKNNIRLNDREISKEHAIIERRGSEWWIRDLRSSNGTYVNTRRITEARLQTTDDLLLGSMHLHFLLEDPTESKSSVRDLVTILPQDPAGSTHIHAKLEDEGQDFVPASDVSDVELFVRLVLPVAGHASFP